LGTIGLSRVVAAPRHEPVSGYLWVSCGGREGWAKFVLTYEADRTRMVLIRGGLAFAEIVHLPDAALLSVDAVRLILASPDTAEAVVVSVPIVPPHIVAQITRLEGGEEAADRGDALGS
jgi:hypothetical protein